MNTPVSQMAEHSIALPWSVLQAPPRWYNIDFISDLHLQASATATFSVWQDYMQGTRADAVFVLGDLFEVWVGDDIVNAEQGQDFESKCAQVLRSASHRLDIFFMHGNRDFLLGPAFAKNCGMTLLDDPTVLEFTGQRWLLSHGDALCLTDTDYMNFRTQVRSTGWQQKFLSQSLAQRQEVARALRAQSEARKRREMIFYEVDSMQTCNWLQVAQANTLIHGHTHKPADHELGNRLRRIVLSDWDATAEPPRAEVLRLTLNGNPSNYFDGCTVQRIAASLA